MWSLAGRSSKEHVCLRMFGPKLRKGAGNVARLTSQRRENHPDKKKKKIRIKNE